MAAKKALNDLDFTKPVVAPAELPAIARAS